MKLFLITLPAQKTSTELLSTACQQRGIKVEILNPSQTNPLSVNINKGDALYRVSASSHYGCLELEYGLLSKDIATFYSNNNLFLLNEVGTDSMSLPKLGIPTPKTIYYIPRNRNILEECVNTLGGFPIVIKASGGHSGIGVMRVDSLQSLFSVSDYLIKQGGRFILKEYCDATSTARIIVLGDKIIGSIRYSARTNDFRSNAGRGSTFDVEQFSPEIEAVAIKATRALGLEFGGVDVMITDSGPMIAEVNFPCFFPDVQTATGTDIAGMMIDHLIAKSRTITGDPS